MTIKRFEDLEIWQQARNICKKIREMIYKTPLNKEFILRDQIHASSGSCMDCIAEGFERDGEKEFINFLSISKGSIGETRSQVYRCFDSGHINEDTFNELINDCLNLSGKISHFIDYLKRSDFDGRKRKLET
jgi:four helix bundle protein